MKKFAISIAVFAMISSCTSLPTTPAPEEPAQPQQPVVEEPVRKDYSPFERITVSKGEFSDKIVISWQGDPSGAWTLYRSLRDDEPYVKLADVSGETSYTDSTVEKGLKVWYRLEAASGNVQEQPVAPAAPQEAATEEVQDAAVQTEVAQTPAELGAIVDAEKDDASHDNFGYIKSKKPAGKKLNQVTSTYTKSKPRYTAEEQAVVDKHMELIKDRIQHPVKLNMILTMSQSYFDSGKMAAYHGFTSFSYNMPEREVYMFDKDKTYVVVFRSYVISRFIRQNNDGVFLERLLFNGVAFAVSIGEREVKDAEGFTRILPAVDTVGFASAYYPQYAGWKSSTAMFVTSRDSLQKELRKAQRGSRD